jgi:hypothetical protein
MNRTLPLARNVSTSSKPSETKADRRSAFVIRRPPRFIPFRNEA